MCTVGLWKGRRENIDKRTTHGGRQDRRATSTKQTRAAAPAFAVVRRWPPASVSLGQELSPRDGIAPSPGLRVLYFWYTRWPRRFCCQQLSFSSMQNGFSLP